MASECEADDARAKRLSTLDKLIHRLKRQLRKGFSEAWQYSGWEKHGGRRVAKHYTVRGQVVECNRKLTAARKELEELKGGAE